MTLQEINDKIAKAKNNKLIPEHLKEKMIKNLEAEKAKLEAASPDPAKPAPAKKVAKEKPAVKKPAKAKKKKHNIAVKSGDKTITPDSADFCKEAEKLWHERRARAKASHKKSKTTPVFVTITGDVAHSVMKAVKSISATEIKKDPKEFAKEAHKLESAAKSFLHAFKDMLGSDYKAGEIDKEFSELEKVINAMIDKHKKTMVSGGEVKKKVYYIQYNVGKAKYVVNFHDGEKTHKDGSPFFDIHISKNKTDLNNFVSDLISKGYHER